MRLVDFRRARLAITRTGSDAVLFFLLQEHEPPKPEETEPVEDAREVEEKEDAPVNTIDVDDLHSTEEQGELSVENEEVRDEETAEKEAPKDDSSTKWNCCGIAIA